MHRKLAMGCCLLLAVLVLAQFGTQFLAARHFPYLQWPYSWDQNRYYDYLLYYRDAVADGGFPGLLRAYRARPPYSVTILATSLPLLAIRDVSNFLLLHQLFYLALFHFGAGLITYRLTRSWRACLTAVAVLHFGTVGLFNYGGPGSVLEILKYQIEFPMCSVMVATIALLLESLYTRSPWRWAVGFSTVLLALLLLRPPALPFFIPTIFPPMAVAFAALRWRGRKGLFTLAVLAAAVASALAAVHFYRIYPQTMAKLGGRIDPFSQSGRTLEWLLYYPRTAGEHSPLIGPVFLVLVIAVAIRLSRLWRLWRGVVRRRWIAVRPVVVFGVCAWVVAVPWALLTLASFRSALLVHLILPLTLIFGTVAFWQCVRDLGRRRGGAPGMAYVSAAWPVVLIFVCTGLLLHQTGDAFQSRNGRREDPFVARRAFETQLYGAAGEYIAGWCNRHARQGVWVGVYGPYTAFNTHNIETRAYLDGAKPQYNIRTFLVPNEVIPFRPELVFLARVPEGNGTLAHAAPALAAVDANEAESWLVAQGYRAVDTFPVDADVTFDVFQYREAVPVPDAFDFP